MRGSWRLNNNVLEAVWEGEAEDVVFCWGHYEANGWVVTDGGGGGSRLEGEWSMVWGKIKHLR